MCARVLSVSVAFLMTVSVRANAGAPVDQGAGEADAPRVEANGYVDARFEYEHVDAHGLVPTADLPTLSALLEANAQLRVPIAPFAFAYADVSLFAALHSRAVPSELYVDVTARPWLTLLAGRKRVIWGAGFAFNPTDLLNPPKDPTDPTLQRAGAWMLRAEAPFEKFTLTALASPVVAADGAVASGRYLAAARGYALIEDADLNLVYYFSNRYGSDDDFRTKSRLGLSASRFFFRAFELHAEALFALGTTRRYGDPAAASGAFPAEGSPRLLLDAALPQSRISSKTLYPRIIAGTRRSFGDESTLSLEYYFQGDGYSPHEFGDFVRLVRQANARGDTSALLSAMASGPEGLPQRFTFAPLRKHYLIAAYSKPKLFEDWTATLTLIAGLADLSGLVSPSVTFAPEQWLSLTAAAFLPIHGVPVGRACAVTTHAGRCPDGEWYGEFSLIPEDARLLVEARAFY